MKENEAICLSGVWDFLPEGGKKKEKIYVPSHWTHGECFGYKKAWEKLERAAYYKKIKLPPYSSEHILTIKFDAVMLKCQVCLNNVHLGGHEGGFTPFETMIPEDFWEERQNETVELKIEVESAASAFTNNGVLHQVGYPAQVEEGPIPGGIWQNVFLIKRPKLHVSSWHCRYSHENRNVEFEIVVRNHKKTDFKGNIIVRIKDMKDENLLLEKLIDQGNIKKPDNETYVCRISFPLNESIQEWSASSPNLYRLNIKLVSEDKNLLHDFTDRIGFREVRVKGRHLLVNGKKTRIFGVSQLRQRVAPYLWRRDYLELYFRELRKLGINSLRLHAVIAPEIIIKVADETGIMLIDQSAIWSSVCGGYKKGGKVFLTNTKREFAEWVERDKNHPSVIIMDVENEQVRIDGENVSWVNELIKHMRNLSDLPVCASAAANATYDDFIHCHCENNLNRLLLNKNIDKPFIAGEWWGPEIENRNKLHIANRKLKDPVSMGELLDGMGSFHKKEIIAQRKMKTSGTYPFGYEVLTFKPIFKKGEKLEINRDSEPDYPYFKYAEEFYREMYYMFARRLYVNPWNKNKPKVILAEETASKLKEAFAPVLIAEQEEEIDFYADRKIKRTVIIVNDSGRTLHGKLSAELKSPGEVIKCRILNSDVTVETGTNSEIEMEFMTPSAKKVEKASLSAEFKTTDGERYGYTNIINIWPKLPVPVLMDMNLYVMGAGTGVKNFLENKKIKYTETDEVPRDKAVLIIKKETKCLKKEDVEKFLESGGRIILLEREKSPDFIPNPFNFKSAAVLIGDEMKGLMTDEKQLNFADRCRINAKAHSVFENFPDDSINPLHAGDWRVMDDAYLRPSASKIEITGFFRTLLEGADRSQIALAELRRHNGLVIMSQIHLERNLLKNPQADQLLYNMIMYAAGFRDEDKTTISSSDKAVTAFLKTTLKVNNAGTVIPGKTNDSGLPVHSPDVRFIFSKKEADAFLKKTKDESSPENSWLKSGGICIISLNRNCALHGIRIKRIKNDCICSTLDHRNLIFGWNSLDLETLIENRQIASIENYNEKEWKEHIRILEHEMLDNYGGLSVGNSMGSLLIEKRTGRGRVFIAGVDLKKNFDKNIVLLWQSMLSYLNVRMNVLPLRDESEIVALKTAPPPLDGDIRKWTNENPDKNVAPWTRAVPVCIDERNMIKGPDNPEISYSHGAVFYALYDEENLYFAAKIMAPDFNFEDIETFRHHRDSIEIRIKDTCIFVSKLEDNRLFIDSKGLNDGANGKIKGSVKIFNDDSECPDIANLKLNSSTKLKSIFYELKVPFEALPYDFRDKNDFVIEASFNVNSYIGKNKPMQCSYPANINWQDPGTFGKLVFKQKS